MKKSIYTVAITSLLMLLTFSYSRTSAQTRKTTTGKSTIKRPSQISIMTSMAKSWFKDVYVQGHFKDPYSYKLMSIDLTPVDAETATKDLISDINWEMSSMRSEDRTETDSTSAYFKMKKTKVELEQMLISLSPAQKKKTIKYLVFLDCYGRNGYGNLALNKYSFYISIDGECDNVEERSF